MCKCVCVWGRGTGFKCLSQISEGFGQIVSGNFSGHQHKSATAHSTTTTIRITHTHSASCWIFGNPFSSIRCHSHTEHNTISSVLYLHGASSICERWHSTRIYFVVSFLLLLFFCYSNRIRVFNPIWLIMETQKRFVFARHSDGVVLFCVRSLVRSPVLGWLNMQCIQQFLGSWLKYSRRRA